jgi:hypothetical protein
MKHILLAGVLLTGAAVAAEPPVGKVAAGGPARPVADGPIPPPEAPRRESLRLLLFLRAALPLRRTGLVADLAGRTK